MDAVSHIRAYEIDRYLAELLDMSASRRLEDHVRTCAPCQALLAEARLARELYLRMNPPDLRARQLLVKPRRERRLPRWLLLPALVAPAAAVVVGLLVLPRPDDERPAILAKGEAAVSFTVLRPSTGARFQGVSGAPLRAGDRLQLEVTVTNPTQVAVYAMDEGGHTSLLLDQAAAGRTELAESFVLDESPGSERLLVVMSAVPLDKGVVERAAAQAFARVPHIESLDSLPLPGVEATVQSILVRKE